MDTTGATTPGSSRGTADPKDLGGLFEVERDRLVWLAHRLLGVRADAEDAVQEGWLRLQRHGGAGIDNLPGWLTTVVSRVCLDMLRARSAASSSTTSWDAVAVLADDGRQDPAEEAELADAVGLALLVVLDALTPAERVALVLHDVFGVPFEQVADILGRSRDATKMAASRARRKVRGREAPTASRPEQRRVVDAFRAAARGGDLQRLLEVLDPSVVLQVDHPGGRLDVGGAEEVARRAAFFAGRSGPTRDVVVAGLCGVLARDLDGSPMSLLIFSVHDHRIVRIDALSDPIMLGLMDLPAWAH